MGRRISNQLRAGILGAVGLLGLISSVVIAGPFCRSCPSCHHAVCEPVPTTIAVKKHCWEVNYKAICIPAFKWWWESCCEAPPCGKVRHVKELKKVEYECEQCRYKWEAPPCVSPCGK